MPAPVTTDAFLEFVAKSGLFDKSALDDYLRTLTDAPEEPQAWAERMIADRVLTPFQAKHLLAGRYKGLVIGQYKVLDQIGKGGTGVVFLAEHARLRRQVALKILPADRSSDHESLERFYREARAVAGLDHPNIVRAYDSNHQGNLHYLVMEYVEGPSLQTYVQKHGAVPHVLAAQFIAQAAAGLQHAYENGMVHRDIKPGNLLLDNKTSTIKILDMGLVRFFQDRDDGLTTDHSKGAVLGTADYLSPEQAMNCHEVDIRADIYSLGVTFFTLLHGQPPFHTERLTQKLMAHQLTLPPNLHELHPEIPQELAAVVDKMMAKKPADRYQTPADVIEALVPWISSITSTLPETSAKDFNTNTVKVPGKVQELAAEVAKANQAATTPAAPSIRTYLRKDIIVATVALLAAVVIGAGLCLLMLAR